MNWVNLWTHRPYSPFVMQLVTRATVDAKRFPKLFPASRITVGGNYWLERTQNYFYEKSEIDATVDALAEKTVRDPSFLYVFLKTCYDRSLSLNDFAGRAVARDLNDEPSEALVGRIDGFVSLFEDMYEYATALPLLGYRHDNPLTSRMNALLIGKAGAIGEAAKFGDYLLVLNRPVKRLQTQDQELAVLKLASRAAKEGIKERGELQRVFGSEIERIREKYSWLSFDFCDTIAWNVDYYASLVAEKTLLAPEAIAEEIESNERYEERAAAEFDEAARKLRLSESEKAVFEVVRDVGYYKWAREQVFQQATLRMKRVQDELGARTGMPSTLESKYLVSSEWSGALKNAGEFVDKAKLRTKNCLMLVTRSGTTIVEGAAAENDYSKMVFVEEDVNAVVKELRGMPACAGVARGRVSVVNVFSEARKMKQGDVLVSVATTPDLVPAMKRASAIVTSEGGVTCHAAIVSRELGIPCVVGVRNVHKILRDGDEVEVDATAGIIKIIK